MKSRESSEAVMITGRVVAVPRTQLVWQEQATGQEHHPVHPTAAQPKHSLTFMELQDCFHRLTKFWIQQTQSTSWWGRAASRLAGRLCFLSSCGDVFSSWPVRCLKPIETVCQPTLHCICSPPCYRNKGRELPDHGDGNHCHTLVFSYLCMPVDLCQSCMIFTFCVE